MRELQELFCSDKRLADLEMSLKDERLTKEFRSWDDVERNIVLKLKEAYD